MTQPRPVIQPREIPLEKVYYRYGPTAAVIGPPYAHEVGNIVQIPPRGPKYGDEGMPGFIGEVTSVHPYDGLAAVHTPTEPTEF